MITASWLPTVKDQARSFTPPASHPPTKPTKKATANIPVVSNNDSTKDTPVAALGSNPQPSANNNDTKMAPRRQLKKPPVQAMIAAGGHLPTVKDQAGSFAAPANTRGATHQPTENAGPNNIPVDTNNSTKDRGPDYKDQVRFVQPPPPQLASAEGVAAANDGGPDYKDQVRNVQPPEPQLASAVGVPVSSSNLMKSHPRSLQL